MEKLTLQEIVAVVRYNEDMINDYHETQDSCVSWEEVQKLEVENKDLLKIIKKVNKVSNFVNLTPHEIVVRVEVPQSGGGYLLVKIPPSGKVARLSEEILEMEGPLGFKGFKRTFGDIKNLPEPQPGRFFIVSAFVLGQCADREDVVAPYTGPNALRDEGGRITAVRGFAVNN